MYHGVVKNKNTHLSANHCSRKEFESEIKYLNENFDIVPLDVLFDLSNQNIKPRRKTIAITFDDGYENNFTNAFPILKKYRVPATIFVVGSCVSNPDYILWYDYLDIIKDKILFSEFFKLSLDLPNEKLKQFRTIKNISELRNFLKTLSNVMKKEVLEAIYPKSEAEKMIAETDPEFRKMLTGDQIREMVNSGLIEIGSHSMTHPNLDRIDQSELVYELTESKKQLESIVKKKIFSVAFPDGAYNENVKSVAISNHYQHLLSVDPRLPSDPFDPSIKPRFCISNTTTIESNLIQVHQGFNKWGF